MPDGLLANADVERAATARSNPLQQHCRVHTGWGNGRPGVLSCSPVRRTTPHASALTPPTRLMTRRQTRARIGTAEKHPWGSRGSHVRALTLASRTVIHRRANDYGPLGTHATACRTCQAQPVLAPPASLMEPFAFSSRLLRIARLVFSHQSHQPSRSPSNAGPPKGRSGIFRLLIGMSLPALLSAGLSRRGTARRTDAVKTE